MSVIDGSSLDSTEYFDFILVLFGSRECIWSHIYILFHPFYLY